jgi:hypothetical protein
MQPFGAIRFRPHRSSKPILIALARCAAEYLLAQDSSRFAADASCRSSGASRVATPAWKSHRSRALLHRQSGNFEGRAAYLSNVGRVLLLVLMLGATNQGAAPVASHADRVLIQKSARQLTLLKNGKPLRSYHVSLGPNPAGPKERQGDGKTPEGLYRIDSRNAYSSYHLALHVSYPNAADLRRARRLHVSPGGEIMIHGTPNKWRGASLVFQHTDWTAGCIAVSDKEIEEIWKLVPDGTVVEIRP